MSTVQYLCGALVTLSLLSGCGNLDGLAQNNLYPTSSANKTAVPDQPPAGYGQAMLDVDNMKAHLWYYKASNPKAPVIIYHHGNGENLGSLSKGFIQLMEKLDAHFVIADYPGYGKGTGVPSMITISAASDTVFAWTKKEFPNSKIVVWGWSLGAAVAARSSWLHQNEVSGVILMSAWTNVKTLAQIHFGSMADKLSEDFLNRNSWDTLSLAPTLKLPTLMYHGTKDTLIPFSMGEQVAAGLNPISTTFLAVQDKGHGEIFGLAEVWLGIKEFVHSR